jgi:hypothetical protein
MLRRSTGVKGGRRPSACRREAPLTLGGCRRTVPASGDAGTRASHVGGPPVAAYTELMDGESQRFQRSRFHVMRVAQTTRDLGIVSSSALAELAVMCEDIATRSGPPRDRHYRDLAERLRASSRQRMAFVEWENTEIVRLFGPDAPPL